MKLRDFDYTLPVENVALYPPSHRGSTRLLVINRVDGSIQHRKYKDLVDFVSAGDVVVLNDTKVFKARLTATSEKGKIYELLLLELHEKSDSNLQWPVLYRGHLKINQKLFVDRYELVVRAIKPGGVAIITAKTNLLALADRYGSVPLPPYLKRAANKQDERRYQTKFANQLGSVAAPTASLNMTPGLIAKLKNKGVGVAFVTLHVGLGTFLPIRSDNVEEHTMHSEFFRVPSTTIAAVRQALNGNKRIIAVGTTVVRTLESCADEILTRNHTQDISGESNIFIYPGYKFQLINGMLTNFHAPRSTVLMMTAAFVGWPNLLNAYKAALEHEYAFLSYGDSMLII